MPTIPSNSFIARWVFLKVRAIVGVERFWRLPTLCWINFSDVMLNGLCAGGSLLSVLLLADVAPALSLFLMWAIYLSLTSIGGEFLSFQWDALLLEAGFFSIFVVPQHLKPGGRDESRFAGVGVWLLRWLLF